LLYISDMTCDDVLRDCGVEEVRLSRKREVRRTSLAMATPPPVVTTTLPTIAAVKTRLD
jgi:hypothetical protein